MNVLAVRFRKVRWERSKNVASAWNTTSVRDQNVYRGDAIKWSSLLPVEDKLQVLQDGGTW